MLLPTFVVSEAAPALRLNRRRNGFVRHSVVIFPHMHQTADSFSCSRPENQRGDHPCNGAFFSICCFISDSIYSRQKVQEVGSLRTASCLKGCLAWFMCMKTDSYQCLGSCFLSWLKPSSVYYMRSLKKINTSRHFFQNISVFH